MIKIKYFTVLFAAVFLLFGCQSVGKNTNDDATQNTGFKRDTARDDNFQNVNNRANDRINDRNRHSNNRASNNTQDEYDVSKEAADRIVDEVADIESAYVLTTRNNAYVAAVLDENSTPNDNLSQNDRSHNSTGTNIRNTNDRNVKNRTVNEGDANKRGPDNHISNRRDVESDEVTDNVKNQIADIVQDVDNDIDNVYVSTSPDFVDLVGSYADDMDNDRPVRGFFDQIGNTIERIFPQNKR